MPPLPPDPIDDVATLPRRDPGEAMARNRPPTSDPVRADLDRTRTDHDWSGGAQAEAFRGRAAGGDGAAQPGREPGPTGNGHAGNGHVGGSAPAGEDGWSSWWTRSTPPTQGDPRPRAESRPESRVEPRPESRVELQAESRVDVRPESRVDVRPESRVDVRPESRIEPRPESQAEPRPEPSAAGAGSLPEPRPPADERETPQLRRRVPQANLAAGLRRDAGAQPEPDGAPVVRDPMAARNALSRFQAAQRAARDAVDGDGGPR